MKTSPASIFLSAGDPSGDIAGSLLISELIGTGNRLEFFGLGGRRMKEAGQMQIVEGDRLAVLGFWEVIKKFAFFRRLLIDTTRMIEKKRPAVVVLIDYPGFNLRLAERIRPLGIPVVYYISPQIWAWGAGRLKKIGALVDKMLLILPFEKDIYDRAGVANELVGHYLLDDIPDEFIRADYDPASNLILLMPGSRPQEVQRMLPTLLATAEIMARKGSWRFAVAGLAGDIDYGQYLAESPLDIDLVLGRTREMIAQSRLVITSSGTATLEVGIIGRPMVVIYKTSLLTYLIARRLVRLDEIALINIAAGKMIVPELIQYKATPTGIAAAAESFLKNADRVGRVIGQLHEVADILGSRGCSARAAAIIGAYLPC